MMIGISVAAKREWTAVLNFFNIDISKCEEYPFGEFFKMNLYDKELLFYRGGVRKTNAAASTQYMISRFNLEKIIIIGTCVGIDDSYKKLDILIPDMAVQYDCSVKEIEPLIKESFTVKFNSVENEQFKTGIIGTADKAVVMWQDYLELKENNITIADTESAVIAYVCKANDVGCIVIKGISDFPTNRNNSYGVQASDFAKNVPICIDNILDNYLEFAVNNNINYN